MEDSKIMKRFGLVVLTACCAAVMAFALAGCGGSSSGSAASGSSGDSESESTSAASASGSELRFVTGGESGTYYAFGSVIAQHATNDAGLAVTALSSGGSKANVLDLEEGNAELGFCQSDVMSYAYNGTNDFEGAPVTTFSTVAYLYDEQVQIVTCDPDIKTVADLKGKNVSIGASGSGVYYNAIDILGAYGLTVDDINPTYESFADSANSIKDGKIDAAFVTAGAPTTAITELSTSKDTYLVALDEEHADALVDEHPFYAKAVIPAGTYKGQDDDVLTVTTGAVVLAADSVSEDDVYTFVSDIFDNAADLTENHAKYAEVSLEKGASITAVPYHPGAAKYFAEKGFDVEAK